MEIRCGWRSSSWKASGENTCSRACLTTALWSSGISGLFLNSDEVLMHGFSCLPLPVLSQLFFGGNVLCTFPLNVLAVSLSLVSLAEREAISFLRFVGGAPLDTWCFLLVAAACRLVWAWGHPKYVLGGGSGSELQAVAMAGARSCGPSQKPEQDVDSEELSSYCPAAAAPSGSGSRGSARTGLSQEAPNASETGRGRAPPTWRGPRQPPRWSS